LLKVTVVPGSAGLDSAMVPEWGVRAEWVAKATVGLGLAGLDSAMVSVVLASGDLDWVTKVVVDAADADRGQQLTHLPTPTRT
jgi:hypothetical protein